MKKKKKIYEFRFTEHEIMMFKEDKSNYKQVTSTLCNCNICSNNSMDKCSDLYKFCKNHVINVIGVLNMNFIVK
jgi:hypothetical protein